MKKPQKPMVSRSRSANGKKTRPKHEAPLGQRSFPELENCDRASCLNMRILKFSQPQAAIPSDDLRRRKRIRARAWPNTRGCLEQPRPELNSGFDSCQENAPFQEEIGQVQRIGFGRFGLGLGRMWKKCKCSTVSQTASTSSSTTGFWKNYKEFAKAHYGFNLAVLVGFSAGFRHRRRRPSKPDEQAGKHLKQLVQHQRSSKKTSTQQPNPWGSNHH